jgi:hypothetical protein
MTLVLQGARLVQGCLDKTLPQPTKNDDAVLLKKQAKENQKKEFMKWEKVEFT